MHGQQNIKNLKAAMSLFKVLKNAYYMFVEAMLRYIISGPLGDLCLLTPYSARLFF
jgi:hypothetical protein